LLAEPIHQGAVGAGGLGGEEAEVAKELVLHRSRSDGDTLFDKALEGLWKAEGITKAKASDLQDHIEADMVTRKRQEWFLHGSIAKVLHGTGWVKTFLVTASQGEGLIFTADGSLTVLANTQPGSAEMALGLSSGEGAKNGLAERR
jgi:hypothetical protein